MDVCEQSSAQRIEQNKRNKFVHLNRRSRAITKRKKAKYRRQRRKRSNSRYYSDLRKLRLVKNTEALCESVSVINVADMAYITAAPEQLSWVDADVAEWQQAEQISFWRSRTLSLEIENQLLHKQIKDLLLNQLNSNTHNSGFRTNNRKDNQGASIRQPPRKEMCRANYGTSSHEEDPNKLPPREAVGASHQRAMQQLYGELTPKVMGMETAIQLNYNMQVNKYKPHYWPNIPLNL